MNIFFWFLFGLVFAVLCQAPAAVTSSDGGLVDETSEHTNHCDDSGSGFRGIEFPPAMLILSTYQTANRCMLFLVKDLNAHHIIIFDQNKNEIWRDEFSQDPRIGYLQTAKAGASFLENLGAVEMQARAGTHTDAHVLLKSGTVFDLKAVVLPNDYCGSMIFNYLEKSDSKNHKKIVVLRILERPILVRLSKQCLSEDGFEDVPFRIPVDIVVAIYPWSDNSILYVGASYAFVLSADEMQPPKELTDINIFDAVEIFQSEESALDDGRGTITEVINRMESRILGDIRGKKGTK